MIEFKDVSKTYSSGAHALNGTTLSVDEGEFVFITGASGAGKSTLLKLIMREEIPSRGDIILDGQVINKLKRSQVPYLRRKMGIVFQDFRLIDKMTVFDNVAFAMRVIGSNPWEVKKRVEYILGLVGLGDKANRRPSQLSGGEQQRVSLARALVNNPKIIIADEPTGNIDPQMSYEIMDLLSEINKTGTTILVVTHEKSLVEKFGRRVIELEKGRVVSDRDFSDKAESEFTIGNDKSQKNSLNKSGGKTENFIDEKSDKDDDLFQFEMGKYDELINELVNESKNGK